MKMPKLWGFDASPPVTFTGGRSGKTVVRFTALMCVLLFISFIAAEYAAATVKPPVRVRMSSDFVPDVAGPKIHVGKKDEVVNVRIEISSGVDMENAEFDLLLPEGWEFVGGDKIWKGKLHKNGKITLKATMRITGDAFGVIEGRVVLPDASTSVWGMLDLRDPKTTNRVPESGEAEPVPPDAQIINMKDLVPDIFLELEPAESLPESSVASMELKSDQKQAGAGDADVVAQASCTVRATGRFVYRDDQGRRFGISYARVRLYDEDFGVEERCAEGTTDWDGYFDLSGTCGELGSDPDIYVKIYSINTNYVKVAGPLEVISETIQDFCGTHDFGTMGVPSHQAGAWQLFNQAVQANTFIDRFDTRPPMVEVNWPVSDNSVSYYDGEDINIRLDDTWNEYTFFHEYGHFIMDEYAASPDPDYCNGICDVSEDDCGHCRWNPENGTVHWTEGWVQFFGQVQVDHWNRDPLTDGFETHDDSGGWIGREDEIEGFTAAILYDIYDSAQDNQHNDWPSDRLSLGFNEIWNVTTNYDPGGTYEYPTRIHEFYDGFLSFYPEHAGGLWNVYGEHHVDKDCPVPLTSAIILTSPADGATEVQTSPVLNWEDDPGAFAYWVYVEDYTHNIVRDAVVTGSRWRVSPALALNAAYRWSVEGLNACGIRGEETFKYDFSTCATPDEPTLLSPDNYAIVSRTPFLDWSSVTNATAYRVELSQSRYFDIIEKSIRVTDSHWEVSPALRPNTTYYWHVQAINACGAVGWWSLYGNFVTCAVPAAPALESPAKAVSIDTLTPLLNWSDVDGAESYEVQVSTSNTFSDIFIARSATVIASQWEVTPELGMSMTYYWRVRARNSCGPGPWSLVRYFRTCAIPNAPTLVNPADNSTGIALRPTLDWNSASGGNSYEVQVSVSSTFDSVARSATVTTHEWQLPSALNSNTLYYWRVRGVNTCGIVSPWSAVRSFRTCLTPDAPALTGPADGALNVILIPLLNWSDVDGAESYEVQLSRNTTFDIVAQSATVTDSQWEVISALTLDATYYWRVRSINSCGNGTWSDVHWFRTTTYCPPLPEAPTLISPVSAKTSVSRTPLLDWSDTSGATSYEVQVSRSSTFETIARSATVTDSKWRVSPALGTNSRYYWRVRAKSCGGYSPWSSVWSFRTSTL